MVALVGTIPGVPFPNISGSLGSTLAPELHIYFDLGRAKGDIPFMDIILGLLLGFFCTEIERRRHPTNKQQVQPLDERKVLDLTFAADDLQQRGKP